MPMMDVEEPLTCPKRMEYGPCGGVRADLSCEMVPRPCPFATSGGVVRWSGPAPSGAPAAPPPKPLVLSDFTVRPYDVDSVAAVAAVLRGTCDGVLVGEHHNRPDLPPTLMTRLLGDAGLPGWITLTCRDRNRVVLEQELAGLAVAGAAGVLCVTGDGRAHGMRPGVTQVFDIDSTRLAALAADTGLRVAVAESPDAPPVALRPARLFEKQRAGAQVCLLNHVGSAERVDRFLRAARACGVTLPVIAGVAVYTDERSAQALSLPGLGLDRLAVQRVLASPDPVGAGVEAAVAEARALLAVDGVVGVNLSGLASGRGEVAGAEVKAVVGERVREILDER
ncbi:methylenetetrahydrofolate reductase [Kineosporia sp. J2-2]|uniref:Methylenetetrahydrofolate reductase n=1 Tax=Kineosporia corallincola TaxID=2835133 RepID=A0ABS5TFR4_9ACTN|nr:methylenetetrahydrofolate reductase [Kineosporia corallincola]MBT0769688.1 methylenetetrahydrofolate reductase [Kineosporia corallincola]